MGVWGAWRDRREGTARPEGVVVVDLVVFIDAPYPPIAPL